MTSDKAAVIAANEAFYRAFEKRDLEALDRVCSQGIAVTCIHPGGNILSGWESVHSCWSQIFRNTNYLEIETEAIAIEVGSELATVVLVENVLQVNRGQRLEARSVATNVFRNLAGNWYLIHHHGSPLLR